MKQKIIHSAGNQKLLLFFSGWGGEPNLFTTDFKGFKSDVMVCYDYRDLKFNAEIINKYTEIQLVAWSMGVFVASQIFSKYAHRKITLSTAINGTPYPIDNERGIPIAVFKGTLQGLQNEKTMSMTLVKFRRRMCGTSEVVKEFLGHNLERTPSELSQELSDIEHLTHNAITPTFHWNRAIISKDDLIITAQNQRNAWEGLEMDITEIEEAHYFANIPYKYLNINE